MLLRNAINTVYKFSVVKHNSNVGTMVVSIQIQCIYTTQTNV